MSGFFEEVKRRKVYRVAVAYVIAAGGIIQLASAAFPAWELPNWALRLVIVLLLIGFPIALILAWAFDVTPQGIKATPSVVTEPNRLSRSRRNLIVLLAAGLCVSVAAGFFLLPRAAARKIDKSIAVLPFESLSDDKENAYFADGIQDDILTNLSKIGDLKVISRTSVMSYRGNARNVREIGKALGVANILEGSVRRSGNKVRVNVQLIDATTDEHIWAEDYDGDLTDVFKIQTDLAHQIADALQAKLSPMEKAQMARKPTENGEAYLAFVQAHNLHGAVEDLEKLKQAEQLYERAIQLDPKFALAFARYSQLESWILHSFDRTPERRDKVRTLAERAFQLQPDLPEAHLALGFSHYYGDRDYDAARTEFLIAQKSLPNDAAVHLALGAIQRRQGKWEESTANLEKAASLNPKDSWPLQNLAFNYEMQRDYAAANKTIDRALQVDPKGFGLLEIKAKLAIEEKGDFSVVEKCLAEIEALPPDADRDSKLALARVSLFLLQRKFTEAAQAADKIRDDQVASFPGALCTKYTVIGVARQAVHDDAGAHAALVKAKSFAEARLKQSPDDAAAHAQLAETLAWLGEKDAAVAEGKRAMELLPESKDAFEGPDITGSLATVYTIVGDSTRAIELLDGLLQRPSSVTVQMLKLNPIWDPLRNDPRFQALLQKYAKT
jgi:TolB-like protein/Tfp pilus assembly protein PilF